MSKITLDPSALEVTSYDPTPVGSEDEAMLTPVATVLIGAGLYALSDAYC